MSQEFRLKSLDEKINYFPKKTKQNDLMSRKYKKILAFTIAGCI